MPESPVEIVARVAQVLDALGVPYVVGGSLASSAHGVARTTNDVDLVADLRPEHAAALVEQLGPEFYIEPSTVLDAIRRGASFNVVHYDTAFKVDIFVAGAGVFEHCELARREPGEFEGVRLYFASPEDILPAKLRWYRDGGEVSDRQWQDILGVVRTQGDDLDRDYLQEWAR